MVFFLIICCLTSCGFLIILCFTVSGSVLQYSGIVVIVICMATAFWKYKTDNVIEVCKAYNLYILNNSVFASFLLITSLFADC